MKRVLCLLSSGFVIFLILCSAGSAEPTGSETGVQGLLQPETDTAPKSDHFHVLYDSLLKKYVRNGKVDYVGFREAGGQFGLYLKSLGEVSEREFTAWSQGQKLAFWINAYNAFTIKAIIVHYPIKTRTFIGLFSPQNSILQIPGVWNRLRFQAVGKMVTLDEIEHEILRKKFKEPRIHFAIVCASMSCPDLASEAYRVDIIDSNWIIRQENL